MDLVYVAREFSMSILEKMAKVAVEKRGVGKGAFPGVQSALVLQEAIAARQRYRSRTGQPHESKEEVLFCASHNLVKLFAKWRIIHASMAYRCILPRVDKALVSQKRSMHVWHVLDKALQECRKVKGRQRSNWAISSSNLPFSRA